MSANNISSTNISGPDDLEMGNYKEYQTFKALHYAFRNRYDKSSELVNNGMVNVSLPRITANPGPVGLCAFALTTFVMSVYNAQWPDDPHSVVLGLTLFYGGLVLIIAGIFDLKVGNGLGACASIGYGGFWLSYGALYISSFNFLAPLYTSMANGTSPSDLLDNEVGVYLLGWTIFSLLMCIAHLRTDKVRIAIFFFITLTFALLAAGYFATSSKCIRAGGAFGIITACCGWYGAMAGLIKKELWGFELPVGQLTLKKDH